MRIGIIGAGAVGSTLARAWENSGHHVALATRNPHDPKLATLALSIGPNASAGAVPRVVEHSEVVVLATPWLAVRDMPGVPVDWSGKILIDCTNPLRPDFQWLEDDYEVSGAERIYLAQLAHQLGLDAATVSSLEAETSTRIDSQPEN